MDNAEGAPEAETDEDSDVDDPQPDQSGELTEEDLILEANIGEELADDVSCQLICCIC